MTPPSSSLAPLNTCLRAPYEEGRCKPGRSRHQAIWTSGRREDADLGAADADVPTRHAAGPIGESSGSKPALCARRVTSQSLGYHGSPGGVGGPASAVSLLRRVA